MSTGSKQLHVDAPIHFTFLAWRWLHCHLVPVQREGVTFHYVIHVFDVYHMKGFVESVYLFTYCTTANLIN